ncbi:MAG: response regulator transcription factor [Muribaculaceae bacterium]|nr:response regulator transcription factor [Muribaculaceae bacterium]
MMRCLVVDDEPLALKKLVTYVEKVPFFQLVASCGSAVEAKKVLDSEPVDVMFIDIQMPDLTGLDFVRSLEVPPLVVFTTAYSDYAVEGYKVNAVDYLLKPFGFEEFEQAASRVKSRFDQLSAASVSNVDEDDSIFIKTEYKIVRICIADITHIEAMSEYLRIYRDGIARPLVVLMSMKKIEERLQNKGFMRIHRSYIVNLKRIKEVNKNHVLLENDVDLPIGDLYKETFMSFINSKFLAK